jgi:hypothetical protein
MSGKVSNSEILMMAAETACWDLSNIWLGKKGRVAKFLLMTFASRSLSNLFYDG